MELSLDLVTLLPALKAISTIEKGQEPRTWTIKINQGRFKSLRITQEGIEQILKGLGAEAVPLEKDVILVTLPTTTTLEEFIESKRKDLFISFTPRSLTKEEIDDFLKSVPRVFSVIADVGERARQDILDQLRTQLEEIKITPLGFADLKEAINYRFEKARIEPGEAVGLSVAEALSALTQAALNAFHQSGSRFNVSAGIEMLQDLLSARKERKQEICNVHFWNKDMTFEDVFNKRIEIASITVGDLVLDYTIDVPANFDMPWWVDFYTSLTGKELPVADTIIELKISKSMMVAHAITMEDLTRVIENHNVPEVIRVVAGPIESGLIYVFPDQSRVAAPLQKMKIPIAENITETFLTEIFLPQLPRINVKGIPDIKSIFPTASTTWAIVEDYYKAEASKEPVTSWVLVLSKFIMTREGTNIDKLITLLRELNFEVVSISPDQKIIGIVTPEPIQDLTKYVLGRINEADKEMANRRKERLRVQRERTKARRAGTPLPPLPIEVDDVFSRISRASKYYYGTTNGNNLVALFARADVDTKKTISNNPNTVLQLLGVEAARNLLIQEFILILEGASLELDPRHIILLSDFMTNRGNILPISYWGMIRQSPGPLTTASFGTAISVFKTAAAFGQKEPIRTVASGMYVGQKGQFGSGYVDLKLDEEKIKAFEEEMEKKKQLDVKDIENAITELDKVTFGAENDGLQLDPLSELATLTAPPPIQPTQVGNASISPPLEIAKAAPIISPLIEENLPALQSTGTLPTQDTTVTVTKQVPPTKRLIPIPSKTRLSTIRRPPSFLPPVDVPKAEISEKK